MKEQSINIVFSVRDYPTGMAGTKRVQHIIDYLKSKDISCTVVSFRSLDFKSADKGIHNGVQFEKIGADLAFNVKNIFKIFAYYLKGICYLHNAKKSGSKNILYIYGSTNIESIIFILFSKVTGYRIIFDIVEDYSSFTDKVKFTSRLKNWSIRKFDMLNKYFANAIVVISGYLYNKYNIVLKNSKPVLLIPISAENKDLKKNKNDKFTAVYSGSYGDKDGIEDLIAGFKKFHSEKKDTKLVLTGAGLSQQKYYNMYSEDESIHFTGYLNDEDYYQIIQDADVLCMCRRDSGFANAGFPFKLGEYLATGNPVIATIVSDVDKYLDNDSAFLVEANSKGKIFEALKKVYEDPENANLVGLKGKEICKKYFSPDKNGEKALNLFNNI